MKKLRRLLAVILTATMLLGNTGITYAAEAAADSTAQAEQEEERSDAGAGQQAAAEVEDSSDNEADSAEPSEEESVAAATAGSAVSTVAAAMADTAESAATAEDSEEEQEAQNGTNAPIAGGTALEDGPQIDQVQRIEEEQQAEQYVQHGIDDEDLVHAVLLVDESPLAVSVSFHGSPDESVLLPVEVAPVHILLAPVDRVAAL